MKHGKEILKQRKGTTLAETMVTLLLISIMMAMAAASLSSASRIYARMQQMQYAQAVLDIVMTELRTITKEARGYVKLYEDDTIADAAGKDSGIALEFLNGEGYVVLVSTDGCKTTDIYIADRKTGEAKEIETGQLLTRYYFRNSTDDTYAYTIDERPTARAVAAAFGTGFYMGNYLGIEYSFPEGTANGDTLDSIVATVTLYSDEEKNKVVASDSEILEFRSSLIRKDAVTAQKRSPEASLE